MKTIVIARHKEDVAWSKEWASAGWDVQVVEKELIGNWGREAASYLWFITENYDRLRGLYVFCQGNPKTDGNGIFDGGCLAFNPDVASPGFFARFVTDNLLGRPNHWEDLPIAELWGRVFQAPPPETVSFSPGAQFCADAGKIRLYPLVFWKMLLEYCKAEPKAPWVLERLWGYFL